MNKMSLYNLRLVMWACCGLLALKTPLTKGEYHENIDDADFLLQAHLVTTIFEILLFLNLTSNCKYLTSMYHSNLTLALACGGLRKYVDSQGDVLQEAYCVEGPRFPVEIFRGYWFISFNGWSD